MSQVSTSQTDWSRLLEVARALSAERDLDALLELIMSAARELLHADRCSLFLVDQESGELSTRIAQDSSTIRLKRGSGIAGSVAEAGRMENIPNAYVDPRFSPSSDLESGYHTKSILAVPLIDHEYRVVGVLQALNRAGGSAFDQHDEMLASALCSQAAVAVSNASLAQQALEHERMKRDMELARTIQQSLLPQQVPNRPAWRVAQWQAPCDQTGGDYHDYFIGADYFDLIVGDVSGHGIGSALLMSTARAAARTLHRQQLSSDQLLHGLNEILYQDMSADQFMTMLVCRLTDDGQCLYAAAGHDAPLIFRAETLTFDDLSSTGLMLGAIEETDYFQNQPPPLLAGDILVACTDGIFEAANEQGVEWGRDALLETIARRASSGAQRVCDGIVSRLQAHTESVGLQDDASLIVVERVA